MKKLVVSVLLVMAMFTSLGACAFGGFGFATSQQPKNYNSSETTIDSIEGKVVVGRVHKEEAETRFKMSTASGTSSDLVYTSRLLEALDDVADNFNVAAVQAGIYAECQTTVRYIGAQNVADRTFAKHSYTSTGQETGLELFSQLKFIAKLCQADYTDNSFLK